VLHFELIKGWARTSAVFFIVLVKALCCQISVSYLGCGIDFYNKMINFLFIINLFFEIATQKNNHFSNK
jgi:hypothetical protein